MSITAIDTVSSSQNLANKNIDSLMMSVMFERAEQLETTVRLIAKDIQKSNEKIKELNDVKIKVATLDIKKTDNKFDIGKDISESELAALRTMLGDRFDDLFEEKFTDIKMNKVYVNGSGAGGSSGTTGSGWKYVPEPYDRHHVVVKSSTTKESLNMLIDGEIGSLNSMSQMTMVELQSSMDKYNNAYSVASNFCSKNNSSIASINSNIR